MINRKCDCGGEMIKSELVQSMCYVGVRIPDGYNFPKDYQIIPFVCKKCGKINFYAGKVKKDEIIFEGEVIG